MDWLGSAPILLTLPKTKYWCQQKRYVQTGAVAPIAEIETGDPSCFFKPVIKRLTMNTD